MSTVARHIKKQRIQKGMTQDSLAGQLFVTRQTVSNWETGRSQPDIDTLVRIAEVLQTDVSVLIYGPTQKPNQEGALRGLCISGGITLLLGLFYMIGMPIARDVSRRLFMLTPYLLLQTIIAPILLFMLGWTLLQGLFTAGLLKPLSKGRKPLFFVSFGVLLLVFLPIVAFGAEQVVVLFLELQYHANPELYPQGFSYNGVLPRLIYDYCYRIDILRGKALILLVASLLGMAFWLSKPRIGPKETIRRSIADNINPTLEQ